LIGIAGPVDADLIGKNGHGSVIAAPIVRFGGTSEPRHATVGPRRRRPRRTSAPLSVRKADAALGLLEDLLAIELMLARDVLAAAPTGPALGAGTGAALHMVEQAIADPRPDAVHHALRAHFPARPATRQPPAPPD
jgi:hypothetical protein